MLRGISRASVVAPSRGIDDISLLDLTWSSLLHCGFPVEQSTVRVLTTYIDLCGSTAVAGTLSRISTAVAFFVVGYILTFK